MHPASVEYLNRQWISPKLRRWSLGTTVDLGFAGCNWPVSDFYVYLSLIFSACYHWWICLLVSLLSSFFLLLFLFIYFNNILKFFYFNNFIWFDFIFLFLSFFFSPFSSELCDRHGLGAPASCQACASEVGELSSGHGTTRDLPSPRNINQQELSQRSPSQC